MNILKDTQLPFRLGKVLIKRVNAKLSLRCDHTVISRQCMFLWHRDPAAGAFGLIEEHGKVEFDLPDILQEALAQAPEPTEDHVKHEIHSSGIKRGATHLTQTFD